MYTKILQYDDPNRPNPPAVIKIRNISTSASNKQPQFVLYTFLN